MNTYIKATAALWLFCIAAPLRGQAEILPPWGPIPAGSSSSSNGAGGTITAGTAPFAAFYSAANVISATSALQFQATEVVVNETGSATMDFRVECDNETHCLFVDASADDVILNDGGTATFNFRVEGDTETSLLFVDAAADDVIVNDGGTATATFRVEGDTNANLIFTDAANDAVGIGTGAPTTGTLTTALRILAPDGTGAAPAFSFTSDPGNGFAFAGSDTVSVATNGSARAVWNTTAYQSSTTGGGAVLYAAKSATAPSFSWNNDTNTGIGSGAAETVDIITNGATRVETTQTSTAIQVGSVTFATESAAVDGVLETNITAVGNVGVGTDDLMTYSLLANSLSVDMQSFSFEAWGTFAATANAKTLTANFGATVIVTSGAIAANTGDWRINGTCIRTTATTQECSTTLFTSNALLPSTVDFTAPAETLSGAVTIKLTGTATANDDIVQEGWRITWHNAK